MIEAANATCDFIQSNNNGLFTLIGVVIGSVGAYLIAESGRKKAAKSIRKNLAQGYLIEIEQLERLMDCVLNDKPGALPKTIPIYPNSGLFLSTRKETLQFPLQLYAKISEFYNIILRAECHHHDSLDSLKEGLKEYEGRRLALINQITAISNETGKILSEPERDKMFNDLKNNAMTTGQIAYSNSLKLDIKREFAQAKPLISELKKLLTDEMNLHT